MSVDEGWCEVSRLTKDRFVGSIGCRRGAVGCPDRDCAADDRSERERSEIPAVKAVGCEPVHEEDFVIGDDLAALPDGQCSAATVTLTRKSKGHAVGDDGCTLPTDRPLADRQDAL